MGLRETLEAATPGPWQVGKREFFQSGHVFGHGEDSMLVAEAWPGRRTQEEDNARLIALAPELAALCLSAEKACKRAERAASRAHDVMWAMDFDKTAAGRAEREEWKRLREQASNEIWKLHEQLRPLLARLDRLGKEQT